MSSEHNYALILAGGAGTRLWPKSRSGRPKQFQRFIGDLTLFQGMLSYATQVIPIERVFVMAPEAFFETIREQAPGLPAENILYEPARRDTGPAIALGMLRINQRDPEAAVVTLWSDQVVTKPGVLASILETSFKVLEQRPEAMVSVGAKPSHPETGYGYIQLGPEVMRFTEHPVFQVKRFVEKPELAEAAQFVASWEYLWNAGYNAMRTGAFLAELARLYPDLDGTVAELAATDDRAKVSELYELFPKLSIDYLMVQKLTQQLVIPADMGWSDVGSWGSIYDIRSAISGERMLSEGPVTQVGSDNCLVMAGDRPITLVGVENLVVVDDGDVLLIINKDRSQRLKELVGQLSATNPELL